MPRTRFQHEGRSRIGGAAYLPVAHGGRFPRAGRKIPPRPEAAYRPGAPVAGFKLAKPIG